MVWLIHDEVNCRLRGGAIVEAGTPFELDGKLDRKRITKLKADGFKTLTKAEAAAIVGGEEVAEED